MELWRRGSTSAGGRGGLLFRPSPAQLTSRFPGGNASRGVRVTSSERRATLLDLVFGKSSSICSRRDLRLGGLVSDADGFLPPPVAAVPEAEGEEGEEEKAMGGGAFSTSARILPRRR
eukprot:scaffold118656_cov21-Tisochrysis_lutea.AAC.1